jgi:RNA recognition motif-containing protein
MKQDSVSIYVAFNADVSSVSINDETLRNLFAPFGQLQDVSIKQSVMDRQSQCQRGYAFVCFPSNGHGMQMALHAANNLADCHINGVHYRCEISNNLRNKLSPPISMNESPQPSVPSPVPAGGIVHSVLPPQRIVQNVQHSSVTQQFIPISSTMPPAMAVLPPVANNPTSVHMSWNPQCASGIISNSGSAIYMQPSSSPQMPLPAAPLVAPQSSFSMNFPQQAPLPPHQMQPQNGMIYRTDLSSHPSPTLLASRSSDASTITSAYSAPPPPPPPPMLSTNNMSHGSNNGGQQNVHIYGFLQPFSAPATANTGMLIVSPTMVPATPHYIMPYPQPQQFVNQQPVSSSHPVMQASFVPSVPYQHHQQTYFHRPAY